MSDDFNMFVKRFLTGRMKWQSVPRVNAIRNFGNIISLILYRQIPFQVELFIAPSAFSTFTPHTHPDVDVVEFALTGHVVLDINNSLVFTEEILSQWLYGVNKSIPIHIAPTDVHSGKGVTPYAFLSLQHWLNNVEPTSVGLNWSGEPSSIEQEHMWAVDNSISIKM